jgi:hypothetical protein
MIWIRIKENGYIMDDIYYEKKEICYVPRSLNVSLLSMIRPLEWGELSPCHDSLDRVAPLSVPLKDLTETEGFYIRRYLKPP